MLKIPIPTIIEKQHIHYVVDSYSLLDHVVGSVCFYDQTCPPNTISPHNVLSWIILPPPPNQLVPFSFKAYFTILDENHLLMNIIFLSRTYHF